MNEKNEDEWNRFEQEIEKQFLKLQESEKFGIISELRTELDKHDERTKDFNTNTDTLLNLGYKNQREITLIKMALFLWTYEVHYHFCINLLFFLLASNDQKLSKKVCGNTKPSFSFRDTEQMGICKKIRLLMENSLIENGFKVLDRKEENDLRNVIAHYNFQVNEDGEIRVYDDKQEGKCREIEVTRIYGELLDFISDVYPRLWKYLEKYDVYPYQPQPFDDFS